MSESTESGTAQRGARPRILLVADVRGWIFERHCNTLVRLLGHRFDFDVKYLGEDFDEDDYDLLFPLEWHLIPPERIRTPAKYVTGIRSHILWRNRDLFEFADLLRLNYQSVHAVSQRLVDTLAGFVPNLEYITHGVDLEFFRPTTTAALSGRGALRVGWAGNRSNRSKGFEDFVLPLSRIPGVELIYCGYVDRNLTQAEMLDFYDSIDCYVCASSIHHEGNNNPLMEAGAMRRAIVTTDNGTVPEYLRNGMNALIVEPELPNFVRAVCALRDDPELRVRLGSSARAAVESHFDWREMASRYERFIDSALAGRGAWCPPKPLADALRDDLPTVPRSKASDGRPSVVAFETSTDDEPIDDLAYWRNRAKRLENELLRTDDSEVESIERFREINPGRWEIVETMDVIRILEVEAARLREAFASSEEMLVARWDVITSMERMISERDEVVKSQASMLDERWLAMESMSRTIDERDAEIRKQASELAALQKALGGYRLRTKLPAEVSRLARSLKRVVGSLRRR